MLGKLDIHCMDLSYWPNCHIRRIQLKFFKWPFTILGPFMGGGSGAEPQHLEAARRRRKFKDRLGHPENSKHFKAQIFTYVKL